MSILNETKLVQLHSEKSDVSTPAKPVSTQVLSRVSRSSVMRTPAGVQDGQNTKAFIIHISPQSCDACLCCSRCLFTCESISVRKLFVARLERARYPKEPQSGK